MIDFDFNHGIELKTSGIELTPEIKAILDAKWKSIGSYKLAVVEYKSPVEVANKIIQKASKASKDKVFKTEIMSKNFRKITAVVYLMNYKQTKEISGGIDAKIKTTISGEDVKITLNLNGGGTTTLTLPGNQRIAYQYSRVCWKEGKPVTIAIDYINRFGGGDAKNCKLYGASNIYPG